MRPESPLIVDAGIQHRALDSGAERYIRIRVKCIISSQSLHHPYQIRTANVPNYPSLITRMPRRGWPIDTRRDSGPSNASDGPNYVGTSPPAQSTHRTGYKSLAYPCSRLPVSHTRNVRLHLHLNLHLHLEGNDLRLSVRLFLRRTVPCRCSLNANSEEIDVSGYSGMGTSGIGTNLIIWF